MTSTLFEIKNIFKYYRHRPIMKIEGQAKDKKKDDSMSNNFLLISLEEKGAKKVAEAINNETSRKILDHLAKKECTESDLSKELKIPISTIHYNLKQLMEAKLVLVDEFHYSSKGKEVNHYKLANKYIIIAPKQADNKFMEALQKILPLVTITAITGGILTALNIGQGILNKSSVLAPQAAPMMLKTVAEDSASSGAGAEMARAATFNAVEVSRPLLQSEMIAWFFIGALSITVIYFIYEMVKRRK
jgi:DNA-binding transcriptional ArsR family regulator